jgi:hypothetical protein
MMRSLRRFGFSMVMLAPMSGCGEDDGSGNVPVAGAPTTSLSAGNQSAGASGDTSTGTGTTDGTTTDEMTGGDTTSGTDTTGPGSTGGDDTTASTGAGSTGSPVTDLLSGQFVDGSSGTHVPPFTCAIRFFAPGQIDPATGNDTGFTLQQTFTVDAFPSDWTVTVQSAGGNIDVNDNGYVAAVCDTDGDLLYDDDVGGWYAALPLTQVTVPATGLDISVMDL